MSNQRLIRLRRPAQLSIIDEPFVPRAMSLDEVGARWDALRCKQPAYFDGPLWHVAGVHRNGHGGATIHVQPCSYRFFAVQHASEDLGCRPLGVKGITWHAERVLVGLRSQRVAGYPGCWELAPGGCVEPGNDPADVIRTELLEEASLVPSRPPLPVAIFFDPGIQTWEIAFRLEVVEPAAVASPEYEELRWVNPAGLPEPLTSIAKTMRQMLEWVPATATMD